MKVIKFSKKEFAELVCQGLVSKGHLIEGKDVIINVVYNTSLKEIQLVEIRINE